MKKIYLVVLATLISHLGFSQFVDTLNFTVDRGFSTFGMANYNCKETHADLGCKSDKYTTCFVCKTPLNEQDSILMYKDRIYDSLYLKIHDPKGTLRIEYLQPHGHSIVGRVKVYDKAGKLSSLEYYSYGEFHENDSPNHHEVVGHKPFRVGLWKYYKKGMLFKTEKYELLHTKDEENYYVLITELIYAKDGEHIKWHNEYIAHLEDLEFQHKPIKYGKPIFQVKGAKPQ